MSYTDKEIIAGVLVYNAIYGEEEEEKRRIQEEEEEEAERRKRRYDEDDEYYSYSYSTNSHIVESDPIEIIEEPIDIKKQDPDNSLSAILYPERTRLKKGLKFLGALTIASIVLAVDIIDNL